MTVSVEALVFIVIRTVAAVRKVMGSTPTPYCATSNKGVRLLSVLELWPIVETSVMSETMAQLLDKQ